MLPGGCHGIFLSRLEREQGAVHRLIVSLGVIARSSSSAPVHQLGPHNRDILLSVSHISFHMVNSFTDNLSHHVSIYSISPSLYIPYSRPGRIPHSPLTLAPVFRVITSRIPTLQGVWTRSDFDDMMRDHWDFRSLGLVCTKTTSELADSYQSVSSGNVATLVVGHNTYCCVTRSSLPDLIYPLVVLATSGKMSYIPPLFISIFFFLVFSVVSFSSLNHFHHLTPVTKTSFL